MIAALLESARATTIERVVERRPAATRCSSRSSARSVADDPSAEELPGTVRAAIAGAHRRPAAGRRATRCCTRA